MAIPAPVTPGLVTIGQPSKPKVNNVLLDAAVSCGIGYMICVVSGYGQIPAAGNAATGKMAGISLTGIDGTGAAQGANAISCEDGVRDFKNSAGNPCSQANVGSTVYAEDYQTIGTNSAAGPPAGELVEFAPANQLSGRPCRVRLNVY